MVCEVSKVVFIWEFSCRCCSVAQQVVLLTQQRKSWVQFQPSGLIWLGQERMYGLQSVDFSIVFDQNLSFLGRTVFGIKGHQKGGIVNSLRGPKGLERALSCNLSENKPTNQLSNTGTCT